jgi:hypothetical protein
VRRLAVLLPLLLAAGALQGCSSLWSGVVAGGATGVAGPGAAAVESSHRLVGGCPDLASQGSIPATTISVSCTYDPATGKTTERADIAGLDPQTILLKSMEAQQVQAQAVAGLLQAVIPMLERIAATAAGGPAGAAAADILLPAPTLPPAPPPAKPAPPVPTS